MKTMVKPTLMNLLMLIVSIAMFNLTAAKI
jgi:hypothetical protein